MYYPEKLKRGATIGLISTSSPIPEEHVSQCRDVIESLGFKVKMADNLAVSKGGYMAGEETARARWVNQMFADPEVSAIFCVRGGDGGNRIVDMIDLDIIRANPKIFVGYSDVTSLHLLFNQQCGLVTFHGPMVFSNMVDRFDEETRTAFFSCINADEAYRYCEPKGLQLGVGRRGQARGPLTGGNLTVMCASLGTPYEIDVKEKILFIEEIGEHIGSQDRLIYQLRNAGKLAEAAGILLGQFTRCRQDEKNYDIVNIVQEATEGMDIPVMYNVQSGHDFPMICLPMGAVCAMDTEKRTVTFQVKRM